MGADGFYGAFADAQALGDRRIGAAFGHQCEHVAFSWCEAGGGHAGPVQHRGGNSQGIDYTSSATQIDADGPVRSPLTIMESVNQCEDQHPTCLKVAEVVPGIASDLVAAAGSGGTYIQVDASHNLHLDVPDQVIAEIDRLAALPR